nr:DegT/DnrJ/EryC1/StrS family aminotransferase [Lachnospiraceae bacterium]
GCYGDGGAVFTDHDLWAERIRSFRVHGKGKDKYDNVRVGINSRLDTLQAVVLQVKLQAFTEYELEAVNRVAARYSDQLGGLVGIPSVGEDFYSSWAQYSIMLESEKERDGLKAFLKERDIPSMIYYQKTMHEQEVFKTVPCVTDLHTAEKICRRVLSLPMHPYLTQTEQEEVVGAVKDYLGR